MSPGSTAAKAAANVGGRQGTGAIQGTKGMWRRRTGLQARRTAHDLTRPSFARFVGEPDRIMQMHDKPTARKLAELLDAKKG